MLLDKGADPNRADNNGATPLLIACQEGHLAIAKKLLDKGADPNKADNNGATPLFVACQEGHQAIVEKLLDKGADPNRADNDGFGLLHTASYETSGNVLSFLLKKFGKDKINQTANGGFTPLHHASAPQSTCTSQCEGACDSLAGNTEGVQILLDNGAQIDVTDEYNKTPLFYACQFGHKSVVKKLLNRGANKTIRDQKGRLPIDIARANKHNDVVRLFEQSTKPKSKKNKKKKQQKKASKPRSSKEKEKEVSLEQVVASDEAEQSFSSSSREDGIQIDLEENSEPPSLSKGKEKEGTHKPSAAKVAHLASYAYAKRDVSIGPNLFFDYDVKQETDAYVVRRQVWHGNPKLLIVYKQQQRADLSCSVKMDAAYKRRDKFHGFDDKVDEYLCYGVKIDDSESDLVREYDFRLPENGYAIVLPGKIAHQYYDYCYVDYDRDKIERGRFDGAFVYLFDKNDKCFHRMFHQSRASKAINNSF